MVSFRIPSVLASVRSALAMAFLSALASGSLVGMANGGSKSTTTPIALAGAAKLARLDRAARSYLKSAAGVVIELFPLALSVDVPGGKSPAEQRRFVPTGSAHTAVEKAIACFGEGQKILKHWRHAPDRLAPATVSRFLVDDAVFQLFYRANTNAPQFDLKKFRGALRAALHVDPKNAEALYLVALSYWWQRTTGHTPHGPDTILMPDGSAKKAEGLLEQALRIQPKFPEASFLLWYVGAATGQGHWQALADAVKYRASADQFIDGNDPEMIRKAFGYARVFLKSCAPKLYKKQFGDQPAPGPMIGWF